MPAIPAATKGTIERLAVHPHDHWPQLKTIAARYRGAFAWVTGILPDGEEIPLFRLRYGGSAHDFGFAIYSAAHDRYDDAVLITGTIHLSGLEHQPAS